MLKYSVLRILLVILVIYGIKVSLFGSGEALTPLALKDFKLNITPPVDTLYPDMEISYVQRRQTLLSLLQDKRLKRSDIQGALAILKSIYGGGLYESQEYILHVNPDSTLKSFILYSKDRGMRYKIARENGRLTGSVCLIPLEKKIITLGGALNTSLYEAMEMAGERPELIFRLIDVFSWDINWFLDSREGDSFKIAVEKYYYGGRFIRYGQMLAAHYNNNGRVYSAYFFNPDSSLRGYFNQAGVSLQKTFLKAPLTYRRVSSGFSYSRLHPVLNYRRPHLGIDYAACTGTPVKAAGNGRIAYAARKGGYGNCIRLDHGNGYSTFYGHLSGFNRSVVRKGRVEQGEVIGYVGATGLCTGPHLDYRLARYGKFINPLSLKSDPMKRVPNSALERFNIVKASCDSLLGNFSQAFYAASR
jgi:murein DD-endopeptidase MepM/ murein hydrolase activator NlpD